MTLIKNICLHHAGGLGTDNFASTQNLSLQSIDDGHKMRWPDFPSSIKNPTTGQGYFVGYTIVIPADGKYVQTRPLGAETAAQVGHNFDSVAICVVGNFMKKSNGQPVDVMTPAQIATLNMLLKKLLAPSFKDLGLIIEPGSSFDLAVQNIYPHRILQPNHTDCNGTFYPDDWGRKVALAAISVPDVTPVPAPDTSQKPIATQEDVNALLSYYNQIQLLWMKINDIFAKKRFGKQALGADPKGRSCEGNIPVATDFTFATQRK